jgi:phosphoribosylformylglycinamidine synthase
LRALRDQDRIAFRYADNPNGAMDDIAGVLSENRRVLGMMPHPERAADPALGLTGGAPLFAALAGGLVAA